MRLFCITNGKKEKEKKIVISAHPGIDHGPLVPKSDTLSTKATMSSRAHLEITVHAHNPSICHIRILIQGK